MIIMGIDPGPKESGVCIFDFAVNKVVYASVLNNLILLEEIDAIEEANMVDTTVIERVSCMGMAVGEEVFETVFFTGRIFELSTRNTTRIKRTEIKMHICNSMRAKDANIRQALIDRFGAQGTKKNPGPLYGVSSHIWPALAVAVTCYDKLTQ